MPAKKKSSKKATAKRSTAKRAGGKKSTARRTTAKRSTAKKAGVSQAGGTRGPAGCRDAVDHLHRRAPRRATGRTPAEHAVLRWVW